MRLRSSVELPTAVGPGAPRPGNRTACALITRERRYLPRALRNRDICMKFNCLFKQGHSRPSFNHIHYSYQLCLSRPIRKMAMLVII